MYDKYELRVTVPTTSDEYDDRLDSFLRGCSYRHENWDNVAPPKKRVVIFNNLSAEQVERAKKLFRAMYAGHKNVSSCSFEIKSEDGHIR